MLCNNLLHLQAKGQPTITKVSIDRDIRPIPDARIKVRYTLDKSHGTYGKEKSQAYASLLGLGT